MNRYEKAKQRIQNRFYEVAIELLLEQGYDALTVAEICRVADYGRSTFYTYFKDKEDLFWAILKHNLAVHDAQILDAIQNQTSPQREWTAWYMIFQSVPFQRAFYQQLNGDLSRRLRLWQREHLITTFEAQLRAGIYSLLIDVPPDIGARFITGAIMEVLEYWLYHPELGDAEVMARHFFKLVFRQEPPS
ncbi:MAG: TetR/AcrR family transcriptional regulator [Chloroflexota bacterium]